MPLSPLLIYSATIQCLVLSNTNSRNRGGRPESLYHLLEYKTLSPELIRDFEGVKNLSTYTNYNSDQACPEHLLKCEDLDREDKNICPHLVNEFLNILVCGLDLDGE
ncbi:hypothetical protein CEXT_216941 [Caerostris extrusa]|uniref:Uncharacterized protein n=1 Tax=Caerostris extrusa TaxID=172846 RepID=A0AAV4NGQ7_CAEEX|nr:hypothetical protein CEXT_216941 [Caerostris extrusa]